MPDTYSDRLGLIKMEEGTHTNEWGDLLNLNIDRLDSAIRGYKKITLAGAESLDASDITTTGSTAQEESFFKFIEFVGTAGTVTVPAEDIVWMVYNNTGGNFTFQPAGGTGVTLNDGQVHFIIYGSSGTTFVDVTGLISPATVSGNTTFTDDVTVQGAFTSLGIDDNADSTALTLDVTTLNATFAGTVDISGVNCSITNATNPKFRAVDSTNSVTTILQSLDTTGVVGTTSAHDFLIHAHNALACTFDSSQNATFAGDVTATGGTVKPTGSTSAADAAAIGFSSANGLMLTGQGSTYDVAALNDLSQVAWGVSTGTVDTVFAGTVDVSGTDVTITNATNPAFIATDTGAATVKLQANNTQGIVGTTSTHGLVIQTDSTTAITIDTSQNVSLSGTKRLYLGTSTWLEESSSNIMGLVTNSLTALTIDASRHVTGSATIRASGATSAGVGAQMGYSAASGLMLGGQGSSTDVVLVNDLNQSVLEVPTGTRNVSIGTAMTLYGTDSITADPDIEFNSNGGIAAEDNLYFNIDSDNNGAGNAFIFGHNARTSAATEVARIDDGGDLTITGDFSCNSGSWSIGGIDVNTSDDYRVNGALVLNATTLGPAVVASSLTSVGTLTSLQVDNININGNTISSTSGVDLNITPLAGQQIVLDGTIVVDAGVVTGATSISSTAFVGALTGNADTATTANSIAVGAIDNANMFASGVVDQTALGANSVGQSEVKTESQAIAGAGEFTATGGIYVMGHSMVVSAGTGTLDRSATITGARWLYAESSGSASLSYINSSPPYDLGDGEIPYFVYLKIKNSDSSIVQLSGSPDPIWAYNGPTNTVPDIYNKKTGKSYQIRKDMSGYPDTLAQAKAKGNLKEYLDTFNSAPEIEIEVTQAIKNADMDIISSPFDAEVGHTLVMVDPMDPIMETLLTLTQHDQGHKEVSDIAMNYLNFGNTNLSRKGPKDLMIVSTAWK